MQCSASRRGCYAKLVARATTTLWCGCACGAVLGACRCVRCVVLLVWQQLASMHARTHAQYGMLRGGNKCIYATCCKGRKGIAGLI